MQKETYLQNCLRNGKVMRWTDNGRALNVYIAPFRFYSKKEEDYKYRGFVIKALQEWQTVSKGKITFAIVSSLMNSQINIDWKRVDRQALGSCYFNFDNIGRLFSAEVSIGISDGIIHKQYMSEDEVYHTILHEIGHAIGLGHSQFKNSIMFTPHEYGITSLAKSDILTLQWLYRLEQGATPSEIAAKYGVPSSDLDFVVAHLISKKHTSDFEKVKNTLTVNQKDLLTEQENIADLKKYNMALQNIKISDDIRKFFINPNTPKK